MPMMSIAIYENIRKDGEQLQQLITRMLPEAEVEFWETETGFIDSLENRDEMFDMIFIGLDRDPGRKMEIVARIRQWGAFVPVVFVSKSERFYKDAFRLYAADYLVKPVDTGKINHALYPVLEYLSAREGKKLLYIRNRGRVCVLQHNRISYISSSLHHVIFHLTNGEVFKCRAKLGDFREQLSESGFFRCHQSFCVNLEHVAAMNENGFDMGTTCIPISRTYMKDAKSRYESYIRQK